MTLEQLELLNEAARAVRRRRTQHRHSRGPEHRLAELLLNDLRVVPATWCFARSPAAAVESNPSGLSGALHQQEAHLTGLVMQHDGTDGLPALGA